MPRQDIHLTDAELLLAADGELSRRRASAVKKHLDSCWTCRERMSTLEETITGFVRARNRELGSVIPPGAGPRALLRARLSQASTPQNPWWQVSPRLMRAALAAGFLSLCVAIFITRLGTAVAAEGQRPNPRMTPGETHPITLAEVCRNREAEVVVKNIPAATQREVLAEYGVKGNASAFEVDYLITPDLGGADTVRNLWPQPYSARWNAKLKDRLEQRLHDLVCAGKVDLGTAQNQIASNWIQAYQQYVTGTPSSD